MTSPTEIRIVTSTSGAAPFLKWIGGKRWLIRHGVSVPVLSDDATYFEPFVGAGSLFFALEPVRAVLGDINRELLWSYTGVKNHLPSVVRRLGAMENSREFFDHMKRQKPRSPIDRATRFIYLNRTSYGGVYRVNRRGEFNVPFGNYTDRTICQRDALTACSAALGSAKICRQSYLKTIENAQAGDFVYLDPPYTLEGSSGEDIFNRYNRHIFTWEMQKQLASTAHELSAKGVHVLVSNTADPSVMKLYHDFTIQTIKRKNQLSRDPLRRGFAVEALYSNYPTGRDGSEDLSQNL